MKPIFELRNICVALKGKDSSRELIKDISLSVRAGECLGILGESGSGKSMSIKAAMGLLDSNFVISGSAKFMGEELLDKTGEELRMLRGGKIGILLQNPMTCFDPLYRIDYQIAETFLAHKNLNSGEIYEQSISLLERMRIRNPEEVLRKYPHQLSGGMLQRIMIGIATAMKPALIIADEPTTAIDAITQIEILNEFINIKQKQNVAMIFISHDLNAISRIADKIVVLNKGNVVDEGLFEDIIKNARDPYTKLLIEKRRDVLQKYQEIMGIKGEY